MFVLESLLLVLHKVQGYVETIRFSDVLDIVIIAYLIYRIFMLAKGSRTGQVLKGILLLIGLMGLSGLLELHVMNYLLARAMEVGLIAIVILFQPELRSILEQFGSGVTTGVFNRRPVNVGEMEEVINQIVEAYAFFSKTKTGALTVFERTSLLDDSIRTGTVLDCAVNSELLKNLFFINAPMHDGAVIIRNGRIAGAGCMLTLSSNTSISRELGMRHRAGIGATEHTDAVVVICSEETGSISVAMNGSLRRHLAPETLRRTLRNELLPAADEEQSKSRMKKGLELLRDMDFRALWARVSASGAKTQEQEERQELQEGKHEGPLE